MKTDEMKEEYDFSEGKRGMFRGRIGKKISDLPKNKGLAVCIKTDNDEVLQKRKIYNAIFIGEELVEVTDETGEKAIYSTEYFLRIKLPTEMENIIEKVAA